MTEVPIQPAILFPNFMDSEYVNADAGYGPVVLGNGNWLASRPLTNLKNKFLRKTARSFGARKDQTQGDIYLGIPRDVSGFAAVNHNIERPGQFRLRASSEAAWSGVTLSGAQSDNAPVLFVTAAGQCSINRGDVFSIAGDETIYQVTDDTGFGENYIVFSEDLSVFDIWLYNFYETADFTVTHGLLGPDGNYNSSRFIWNSGGDGFITNLFNVAPPAGTCKVTFYLKVRSVTRSSGTNIINIDIGDGTEVAISDADVTYDEWVKIEKEVTASGSGWFDISAGPNVTSYDIEITKFQITVGATSKAYAKTFGNSISNSGYIGVKEVGIDDSENLLTYSEQLDNAIWVKTSATITANAIANSEGELTADKVTENSGTSLHKIVQTINTSVAGQVLCFSAEVKAGERSKIGLLIGDSSTVNSATVTFDITGKLVFEYDPDGTFVFLRAGIQELSNGWIKIFVSGYVPSLTQYAFHVYVLNDDYDFVYNGDGTSGLYVSRVAVCTGSYPREYIVSVASATGVSVLNGAKTDGTALTCYSGNYLESVAYDSGLFDVWPVVYSYGTLPFYHPSWTDGKLTEEEIASAKKQVALFFDSIFSAYWRFNVEDTGNADGYIDIGRMGLYRSYEPTYGIAYGSSLFWFTDTVVKSSKGGARIANEQDSGRKFQMGFEFVKEDEAMVKLFDTLGAAGIANQVFVSFSKNDTTHFNRRSFLCTFEKIDNPLVFSSFDACDIVFNVQEVLA